jgi:outer membrane protein TolC
MTPRLFAAATALLCAHAATAAAQTPAAAGARSVLELSALHQAAINADPRLQELQLQQTQFELRLRNLKAEHLPSIAAEGLAQYQSDVPTPPPFIPGGRPLFLPLKGTLDASVRIEQRILDSTIGSREETERTQLAEAQARVRTALFALRQDVNDAFFSATLLQERSGSLASTIADLETRLRETSARVREGVALASEAASVEATLLQRRQDEGELRANRHAALARLARLTGRAIADDDVLAIPQLDVAVAQARRTSDDIRARPEYEQFSRSRERLARQQEVAGAQEQPRLTAFARVGYGRPGLNFISDQWQPYGLAGVRLIWNAWTGGTANREKEELAVQQQIVAADEAAFTRGVGRAIEGDLATIDHLQTALALDDRIVTLREGIERSTQLRFQEGAVTAADYLDRSTELLAARFARAGHRVELAQASARFLTTLGLEVR